MDERRVRAEYVMLPAPLLMIPAERFEHGSSDLDSNDYISNMIHLL